MRRRGVITPTPPSSPTPTLPSGDSSGLGEADRTQEQLQEVELDDSQDSEVFFATEHTRGFLHSSHWQESTLPQPYQDRLAWDLPAQDHPPGIWLTIGPAPKREPGLNQRIVTTVLGHNHHLHIIASIFAKKSGAMLIINLLR